MKKALWIILISILTLGLTGAAFIYNYNHIHFLDFPNSLEEETVEIEVQYIRWACPCANWLPLPFDSTLLDLEYDDGFDHDPMAESCIFIEATSDNRFNLDEWEEQNGYQATINLKLTGRFYSDKGISRDYISPVAIKPKHARVFQYDSYQVLTP